MKLLVTGGAGYIGSVLVRRLLKEGYYVRVLDNLLFGQESLAGFDNEPAFEFIQGDIRDKGVVRHSLKDMEAVIHLAALVSHPLCDARKKETEEINYQATCLLLDEAASLGAKRFIFASTCSNYGISNSEKPAAEDSLLNPLSLYAESKVKAEEYILSFGRRKSFCTCILRLATIFGLSNRMRFDLFINGLVRDALIKKRIHLRNLDAWRPFLHTQDAASVFIFSLQADPQKVCGQVFNVGSGNYRKRDIVDKIKKYIPQVEVEPMEDKEDMRDYKVSFAKIQQLGFETEFDLDHGILEVRDAILKGVIPDPQNSKYTNMSI